MHERPVRAHQRHAVLRLRDEKRSEICLLDEVHRPVKEILLVLCLPCRKLELLGVGCDGRDSAVLGEVVALGVNKERDVPLLCHRDELLDFDKRALRVVGEHHRPGALQRLSEDIRELIEPFLVELLLEVNPEELLVAAQNSELRDRRAALHRDEAALDALLLEEGLQLVALRVLAGEPDEHGLRPERGDVERDVRRTARARLPVINPHDRNRRLRRDAEGRAREIAVEHHVSDDNHRGLGIIRY